MMEALSPRSVNIQFKPNQPNEKEAAEAKAKKVEAIKSDKALKDKEHAPPPPPWVYQPPLRPGQLVEKYRSGNFLGKGGFAICYEGELDDRKYGQGVQKFAMKIVRSQMNQKKTLEKFRTELQIHAKMQHPNIVEFHRAFTYKECTYVILELCPNASVLEMVRRRRCLTLPEVRRFTIQICGAIKYMHSRNVIHRDLKMGNLFLDKSMNIKLGDFGLAAILVSKEEYQGIYNCTLSRRTTVCGTPNYIAPELLEKSKNGHDHKVDIWAIGVIVFAMLTGHPPFQSSTSDEIYRRVKSVEYDWPGAKACANDIPDQAKDLVAWLLQADAEERPDTDEVVGHPFFSMHGGNAIPLILENTCRTAKPAWLKSESPRGDVMRKDCEFLPLKTLARQCGVGKLAGNEKPFEVIGGNVDLSMYKECLLEEEDESYPIVPLPKDMVYTGKVLSRDRRNIENSKLSSGAQARLETKDWKKMEALALEDDELQGKGPVMRPHVPPRSHAATLRMAHLDTMPSQAGGKAGQNRPTLRGEAASADVGAPSSRNLRPRRGLLMEFPLRSTSNPVSTSLETGTSAKPIPRVTRSKSATVSTTRPTPVVEPPIGIDKQDVPKSQNEDQKDVHRSNLQKGRIAINVQNEMAQTGNIEKQPARSIRSLRSRQIIGNPDRERLIGPDEVAECVPGTKPNEVLSNLEKIYKELDSSLRSLNSEIDHTDIAMDIPSKKATSTHPVIVKWVDYTNKFGVGYILANGTVGCIFNGDSRVPYSCVVVAGAERHVSKRKLASYVDKEQIVQRYGAPAEFLEDCGGNGIKRVFVPASKLQVKGGPSGIANSFEHEATGCDFEKHKRLSIWGKFGKYMTQNIDLNLMDEESGGTARNRTRRPAAGPFVKFYQRLGNVGIWGYDDGSFQLNFPDHTKFIMSDGGSWLDYYYLPIETANALKQHGHLGKDELADRSMLSYPTAMMVRGISPEQDFRHLIAANAVISKLEFVRKVVGIWLACGGLGCLGSEKYLKWEGTREGSGNLIWASVGAHGGDRRYQVKQDV